METSVTVAVEVCRLVVVPIRVVVIGAGVWTIVTVPNKVDVCV
ncbi:MAG TPA: hypothetical protein VFE91_07840 [Nitrososphaerales archaeon]|nr:hypothetical protein [Nitrososphaerales archaeon]